MSIQGLNDIKRKMDEVLGDRLLKNLENAYGATVTQGEADAKRAAPWKDRTGNARASITGSGPKVDDKNIVVALAIGVHYGKYLELSFGGKYRIIWPTTLLMRPDLIERIGNALR